VTTRPTWHLTITPTRDVRGDEGYRLLRAALKRLLRCLGLRVVTMTDSPEEGDRRE
jgi:hypothetical protein